MVAVRDLRNLNHRPGGECGIADSWRVLTDASPWKRALIAAGIVTIASAALILALYPTFLS
jgi:hypothetical protein